jgi:hypothetical protein
MAGLACYFAGAAFESNRALPSNKIWYFETSSAKIKFRRILNSGTTHNR